MRPTLNALSFQVSAALITALFSVFFLGCAKRPMGEREQVRLAIGSLAPQGGNGVKSYLYDSGELMQEIEWREFKIVSLTWYSKSGKLLLKSKPSNHRCLILEMYQTGEIKRVFESDSLVEDGVSFEFGENGLKSIKTFDFGKEISSVNVSDPLEK
jgi:hypothetical protein